VLEVPQGFVYEVHAARQGFGAQVVRIEPNMRTLDIFFRSGGGIDVFTKAPGDAGRVIGVELKTRRVVLPSIDGNGACRFEDLDAGAYVIGERRRLCGWIPRPRRHQ